MTIREREEQFNGLGAALDYPFQSLSELLLCVPSPGFLLSEFVSYREFLWRFSI